ncbi:hypothetical protein BB560_005014 [Smittium megazygosporum]|uniref:Citrate transporter-like domain-containing protein n=1 Tax=Smittium megazygosporum TaxID=133381 RepID=A0A2T9Z7P2_9FUNG|nr:hypothetical protein BB560_005014 [Smittium megazygosporum]
MDTPLLDGPDSFDHYSQHRRGTYFSKLKSKIKRLTRFRLFNLVPSLIIGLLISFLPPPQGISKTGVTMFAVFFSTIFAIITSGYRISVVASIAVCVLVLSNNLMCKTSDGLSVECHLCGTPISTSVASDTKVPVYLCKPTSSAFESILSGFSADIVWLIFSAFQIGKAVQVSNLGKRIALNIIYYLGRSTLGIGYAIAGIEVILAMIIPSNSARGGGIVFPVVKSIISSIRSDDVLAAGIYKYITVVGAYSNTVSSTLFLTAMAGNPIIALKAKEIFNIDYNFSKWFIGAFFPMFLSLLTIPLICKLYFKPSFNVSEIRPKIIEDLSELKKISTKELKLIFVLVFCIIFWAGSTVFQISASFVAFVATTLLILLDVLDWNDILGNTSAWDTIYWLAIFLSLAKQLSLLGISSFIGRSLSSSLDGLPKFLSMTILSLVYYYSTYLFSSTTSHVVALCGPFMEAAKHLGLNNLLFTAIITISSSASAVLAPYCCGSIAIYASMPYVELDEWFSIGFLFSLSQIFLLLTIGTPYYYLIGWL